jgi:serine/threonine-protein kinase
MTTGRSYQKCPVCATSNDVSVFVSGQKARCTKCGIAFIVARPDIPAVSKTPSSPSQKPAPSAPPPAAAVDETQVLQSNPVIPGYEILEVIGKGGMGTVYKGRQISLNRVVAIKVLARELASDKDFIERFDREASALAKLSHPNIVPIIDKGAHEGVYYFVMDFVQGNTLRDLLRGNRLSQEDAVKISLQVCRALAHAHVNGVVHRDMKPENVLLDREQNVRIADFGLADIIGHQTWGTLTGSGMAMGTAHYMAPEQRRDAKRVDRRADIYSMGIMIYEMLTGEIPQGSFKKPSEHTAGITPAFDRIVIRCLQMAQEDRYPNAEELMKDLRAVFPGQHAEVLPPPAAARAPALESASPDGDKVLPSGPQQDQHPKADPSQKAPPPPEPPAPIPPPTAGVIAPPESDGRKAARGVEKAEIRPISVRRQQVRRLKLIAFGVGAAVIVAVAVIIVKSCL